MVTLRRGDECIIGLTRYSSSGADSLGEIQRRQSKEAWTAPHINARCSLLDRRAIEVECLQQPNFVGSRRSTQSSQRSRIEEEGDLHCGVVGPESHPLLPLVVTERRDGKGEHCMASFHVSLQQWKARTPVHRAFAVPANPFAGSFAVKHRQAAEAASQQSDCPALSIHGLDINLPVKPVRLAHTYGRAFDFTCESAVARSSASRARRMARKRSVFCLWVMSAFSRSFTARTSLVL